MKTLDRYILWSFITAVLLWLVVLLSLRVVVDLFVKLDEFAEESESAWATVVTALGYYVVWLPVFFQELGKVAIVFGALTTLYTMSRTNELTAMLASGQSLHRVIWPIVFSAMLLGGLNVINQEFVIPPLAPLLAIEPDEWAKKEQKALQIYLNTDATNSAWYSRRFEPSQGKMAAPAVVLREDVTNDQRPDFRGLGLISGTEARPGTLKLLWDTSERTAPPLLSGWDFQGGKLNCYGGKKPWPHDVNASRVPTNITGPAFETHLVEQLAVQGRTIPNVPDGKAVSVNWGTDAVSVPSMRDDVYGLALRAREFVLTRDPGGRTISLVHPQFIYRGGTDNRILAVLTAARAVWRPEGGPIIVVNDEGQKETAKAKFGHWHLVDGRLFCPSDLTPDELRMRQSSRWLDYLGARHLSELLTSGALPNVARRALVTKHIRFADPVNSLVLLLLVIPFILSRERNIKASAGLGILTGLMFYAIIYICRYVALDPTLAAWLPVMLFGPVSVVMLDAVKT